MEQGFLKKWPRVIGEFETIRKLKKGFSISRFGDGEFKMAYGNGYRREDANTTLAEELTNILQVPKEWCLVGIPTMNETGNKFPNWDRHRDRFINLLSPTMRYYSAFISRPDSAQWIMCREYAEEVQKLWAGKNAVVVCETDNSMLGVVAMAARNVLHIPCPSSGAYALIDEFEETILKSKCDVAVLCVGPTATCLAHRLSDRVPTLDFGSAGGFLRKMLA